MDKKSFKDMEIHSDIRRALKMLGYENPMEVQQKVIPHIMKDKDLIVKSQTGSGKTAAFGIPICDKLEVEQKNPQALILTPTRELALQIKEDIGNIGKFKKIRAAAVYGRHPMHLQERELRQRVHVVVGTPGRTKDHIDRGNLVLEDIRYLVIDEADEMLSMGFIDQVESIIKMLPKKRSTLLFSATMPEKIEEICNKYLIESSRIEIEASIPTQDKIDQYYLLAEDEDKEELLYRILVSEMPGSCILFCNTRDKADKLAKFMIRKRYSCGSLHGGMTQRERTQTINKFKKGELHYLVATDVAARGIDVEDVTHVINYEMPYERENYVHRIGRTGRMDKKGTGITLLTPKEKHRLQYVEEYLGYSIKSKNIADFSSKLQQDSRQNSRRIKPKQNKGEKIHEDITRIRINAGKKKKIRPVDIMGAIGSIEGIEAKDIGIIDIQDTCTYVEVFEGKEKQVFNGLKKKTIKGKAFTIKELGKR
jgi:superfamily II DNA/RNA helicase